MSKVYANSHIYCSCSSRQATYTEVIENSKRCHSIHDLSFCPSCQVPKCKYCIQSQMTKKFCANCMRDYSNTDAIHCSNCSTCPLCASMLTVSLSDREVNGVVGKEFNFVCTGCDFVYGTDVITKPKSIFDIVKSEYHESNELSSLFSTSIELYKNRAKLEILNAQLVKDIKKGHKYKGASIDLIKKLEQMDLTVPEQNDFSQLDKLQLLLSSIKPEPIDEYEDVAQIDNQRIIKNQQMHSNVSLFSTYMNNNIVRPPASMFPNPMCLTSRNAQRCCDCSHNLLVPSDDLLSTKFEEKWNANDYLPILGVSPIINKEFQENLVSGKSYTFLVNIINPLPFSVDINLSVPHEYQSDSASINATIPVSDIKIGGLHPKDHIIRGIPTPYLTRETKLSRAELVMRLGKLNSNRNADTSLDVTDSLVDRNDNWCSIPLEVSIGSKPTMLGALKIPIFLTLQSRLPEIIKEKGLSKKTLSCGVWYVVNLGEFPIVSS
ncbi:hypothetical protein CANTEDRAFT_100540 [Yamadazyma tenuis ATCC 10573]|uniref:Dynactin subunit 4 n=1 Tax=Candida tenuis (strain ATCC 10573 / BCRC 21748 / CBS 615 / JCM 9827 / NBRC 10315 / NRRL Y-1498 / VKM Y-70) TaxID=590646 RepID=G3AXH1_CANTC|nr:uncharacterized protein CANTEDRAFT_100540 [Yamadazyma tenuis ATCC 10573]EGV66377.1 hypothetical protein CANTEDRAFT_100540 [Yamadazyma tenuis ATCC 10573]